MNRAEAEARIWAIAGRQFTGAVVDALLDVCEEYASERRPHPPARWVLHHTSGTDLHPVIAVLAGAMLDGAGADSEPTTPAVDAGARRRLRAVPSHRGAA